LCAGPGWPGRVAPRLRYSRSGEAIPGKKHCRGLRAGPALPRPLSLSKTGGGDFAISWPTWNSDRIGLQDRPISPKPDAGLHHVNGRAKAGPGRSIRHAADTSAPWWDADGVSTTFPPDRKGGRRWILKVFFGRNGSNGLRGRGALPGVRRSRAAGGAVSLGAFDHRQRQREINRLVIQDYLGHGARNLPFWRRWQGGGDAATGAGAGGTSKSSGTSHDHVLARRRGAERALHGKEARPPLLHLGLMSPTKRRLATLAGLMPGFASVYSTLLNHA